jgi:HemY protein
MINLLLFLLIVASLGLAGAWFAESSGSVSMQWFGYNAETSGAFLLFTLLFSALFISLAFSMVRSLIGAPRALQRSRRLAHHERALRELTGAVAALATADTTAARKHVGKVEKMLGTSALTLMLGAQIARNAGDDAEARLKLEQLLAFKDTHYLAARSLSDAASQQDDLPRALGLAQQAFKARPKDAGAALLVASLHARMGQWQEALSVIDSARMDRTEKKRMRGLVQLEQARILHDQGHDESALHLAKQALVCLPDFAPAATLAALSYSENHQFKKALKALKRGYEQAPHPLYVSALRDVLAGAGSAEQTRHSTLQAEWELAMGGRAERWECSSCGHAADAWKLHCNHCHSMGTLQSN